MLSWGAQIGPRNLCDGFCEGKRNLWMYIHSLYRI